LHPSSLLPCIQSPPPWILLEQPHQDYVLLFANSLHRFS
jgi:hypothetical protein